tara:strand:- start:1090 stop:2826 length:1737 start_codon:yes stop_codon:yes gene_type:complete
MSETIRIPKVYRSQTQMKADSGARPLTAQLSAAAMAAPAKAQAAVAGQTTSNLLEWSKKELSIRRATNVTAAENAYKTAMFEHEKVASGFNDPEHARVYLARVAKKERARLKVLTGSFDSVTKTRVKTALATEDGNMVARARTEARKRMVSGYIADTLNEAQTLKQEYATASPVRKRQIQDKLFGRVGGIDPVKKQTIMSVEGVYQKLVRIGAYDAEQQQKAESNDRADLAEGEVRQALLDASRSGDSTNADKVFEAIQGGKYPDLDPEDATRLSERAESLSSRLARQAISSANAQIIADEKALKRKQRMTEAEMITRIARVKAGEKGVTLPTAALVTEAFARLELSREGHARVLDALEKRFDPIVVNKGLARDMIQDIYKATTQADLDEIKKRAVDALKKDFDIETLRDIENRIDARKNNTREYRQNKSFESVIESWTKTEGILDSILPGAKQRGQVVLDQFRSDVADGIPPLEAFKLAVNSFRAKPTLQQLPQPRYGPNRPVTEWGLEDVEEAIAETKTKFKGTSRGLASQMITLFLVKRYLESRGAVSNQTDGAINDVAQPTQAEINARKKNAGR